MLPLFYLVNSLSNLITLVVIGSEIYLIHKWYKEDYANYSSYWFLLALFLLLISSLGWYIFPLLFGGRKGEKIPKEAERITNTPKILFTEIYPKPNAPTLIFTHGWSTTAQEWHYFREKFKDVYNLIFWDEPGLGKSKLPVSNDYSLTKYAHDLKTIVDTTDSKDIILVGHSIGGMIIQEFYRKFPNDLKTKIKGLVLVNTTYINPTHTAFASKLLVFLQPFIIKPLLYIQIVTWPIWQLNNWLSYLNGSLHISMLLTGFTGKQTKAQLDLASYFMASARVDVVSKGMLGMLKLDTRALLPTIVTPTLVLGGDHDVMTKPEASIYISSQLPHSTLHIIPDAGHMGLLEQHEQYTKITDQWLKKVLV